MSSGSRCPQRYWSVLAVGALALTLGLPAQGQSAQDQPIVIDPAKRRAITQEVLSSQRDPRGREQKLEALRAYERFVMEDLVGRSALRAEAMHNLGDLYSEIETATERTARGRSSSVPSPSRAKSIAVYERLLALYPGRAENDGALYQLARAYWETGRLDDAAARLRRILTEHSKSAYASEAAFRLGLRAFSVRDFSGAADLFAKAARGHDPELVAAARFHLGWTLLNLQEYRSAADAFASILDTAATKRRATPNSFTLSEFPEAEATFLSEVVKALLLAFDYLGGPDAMAAYFKAGERRPYEETLYRTLGGLYQEQDRTADEVAAYETFLTVAPLHREAPRFQVAVAETYARAKRQAAVIQARERLAERYGSGTPWARANPEAAKQVAQPLVKDALYQLALYEHAQAQNTRRVAAWEKAVGRHDRFLASFPRDVNAARVTWLRGEALFELQRYAEAADAYQRSAYDYPLHAQTREAAYAAVAARERLIPADGAVAPDAAERLAATASRFVETFPDDGRNPDLLMKAAQSAERANRTDLADSLARRLVERYPTSRWAAPAQRIIGQSLYDKGRFLEAEQTFRRARTDAADSEMAALNALAASALYQRATQDRRDGRTVDALNEFIRVASDYPSTSLAPSALAEAAQISDTSGRSTDAAALRRRLVDTYPNSAEAPAALRMLAGAAEASGDLAGAIEWYERLAARSEPAARDELAWTVAALAERASDWKRAESTLGALAARSDLPAAQTVEAGFRAADAAARQGRGAAGAGFREAALARYRTWRTQDPARELTRADVLAAQALVELGDQRAAACAAIHLREPLERTLSDKRAALDASLDAYTEAVTVRVPETTTAATHKIGTALDEFFQALLASERPSGLTDEQREQYTFLLEEQAAPFEERAVSAYEANVRRAQELGLYDGWIAKSYERLAALRPVRYHRPEAPELVHSDWDRAP
ncbi:MAG: tetratricopeptide repeat protein [Nitrospirota bacterium]